MVMNEGLLECGDSFCWHLHYVCRLCKICVWRNFCTGACSCCGSYEWQRSGFLLLLLVFTLWELPYLI